MKPYDLFSGFAGNWHNFLRGRRLPFKLGVIATLAIAIGANIAVLGNLGVFFGPVVPGAAHRNLLEPWMHLTAMKALAPTDIGIFRPMYDELAQSLKGRAETALYQPSSGTVSANGGPPERLAYLQVTPSLANVLGVRPVAGRMLTAGDALAGAAPVMLISENLARARFGSAQAALEQPLTLSGKTYTVVGVLPGNLVFPSGTYSRGYAMAAWLPFAPEPAGLLNSPDFNMRALVVVQLVASLILLATTAHLQSKLFGLKHGDLGFTPAHRAFLSVILPGGEGDQTEAQYAAYVKRAYVFDQELIARMQTLPGVKTAAALSLAPLSGGDMSTGIRSAPNAKSQIINVQTVSQNIVPALGLRVLAGNPDETFRSSNAALLLDESAVRALWPGTQPAAAVGRDVYIDNAARRVAAVVSPLRMRAYGSVGGTVFMPMAARHLSGGPQGFVINSALSMQVLRTQLQGLVSQINPQARITAFQSADELVAQAYAARNRLAQIFGLVALVTLVIAAVGLFALLAYRALVRRPEFAIRGALGATPARLFFYVLAEAAALWIIGCVIGIPLAYLLSAQLAVHLPELGAMAPWVVAVVVIALGIAALIAALVPALRTSHVELSTNLK